jgi:DNA-binding NarL/FixJ family response regulator
MRKNPTEKHQVINVSVPPEFLLRWDQIKGNRSAYAVDAILRQMQIDEEASITRHITPTYSTRDRQPPLSDVESRKFSIDPKDGKIKEEARGGYRPTTSDYQKDLILKMKSEGKITSEIAREVGVSERTVRKIIAVAKESKA